MTVEQTKAAIENYKQQGLQLFTTCSFQTHSLVMLHMIMQIDKSIPVYFINTGFHFPETISFKDEVAKQFGIDVINVFSGTPKHMQKDSNGRLMFASDPDYCCYLNKTLPLEPMLHQYDVWINGVRADQSAVRKNFRTEEPSKYGCKRFHPMLDWNAKMIFDYRKKFSLPHHPLEDKGYFSIGCEPCTRKFNPDMDSREGRWYGLNKTECGINTDLVSK